MSTKIREYRTKVPYTVAEWRKGQRYVLAVQTTDEVQILDIKQRREGGSMITETSKLLNLSKRLPGVIKKIMKENALCFKEYSVNIDVMSSDDKDMLVTKKEMKAEGLLKKLDEMKVQEMKAVDHKDDIMKDMKSENLEEGEDREIGVDIKQNTKNRTVSSTCETSYTSDHYGSDTFTLLIKTLIKEEECEGAFGEKAKFHSYDLAKGREPFCYVYKLIDVKVNSLFFGWVADHVKNSIRDMLHKFHEKILETENEWKNLKEEELVKLEQEMIKKYLKAQNKN